MKKKTSIRPFPHHLLFSVLTLFLLFSCSSKGNYDYNPDLFETASEVPVPQMTRMEISTAEKSLISDEGSLLSDSTNRDAQTNTENQRKRIYNGSAGLVVEDLADVRKNLENLANDSGGYVEQSYETYLILRIPAARFDDLFRQVLSMGTIRYQQIDTWDVTDQYQDSQARLSTAEETRRRLYTLLERSTDPKERAKILREIGRLTEEIESIKQQLQILDSRISFSRITVELIPRLQEDAYREEIPFGWIASLSPLSPVSDRLKAFVKLDPGNEFALFSKEKIYVAEDAHGTGITISSIENKPQGDGEFWQKALYYHLKDYYASAELKDLRFGEKTMRGVEFLSKDRDPFRYFVGLIAEEKKIHVVEIFSPDGEKDFAPLYKAFEEGVCR